jgi:hypothetical protein
MPLGVVLVTTLSLVVIWSLPADTWELEAQFYFSVFCLVPAALLLGVWWFWLSGVSAGLAAGGPTDAAHR